MRAAATLCAVLTLAAVCAALASCGKKGGLEPPEGGTSGFPHVYPKPESPPKGVPPLPPAPQPQDNSMPPLPPLDNRVLPQ